MAGDPPLKQVVARTWEAGFREALADNIAWNLSVFSTTNSNDIQFIAANTSEGFFSNVGQTRRRGVETGLSGKFGSFSLGGNYTYLDATYQSDMELNGVFNSSTSGGEIDVKKGDRIPLVPHHMLKLYADYQVTDKLVLGLNTITVSDSLARGNENGQHSSQNGNDPGKIDAYTVVNLSAAYQLQPKWNLFGRINNVFDTEYETAALLGQTPFNAATGTYAMGGDGRRSTSVGQTFLAPGAPRTGWVGVRYSF
jgi:outer membrane receptor protein involved in Fe transport